MSLEDLFSKLAVTTVSTVSRIALSHATNAAIRNVTTYITQQTTTESKVSNKELLALQRQLDLKIKNLKPAVDMISRNVANGNLDLEPALEMCNDLKRDLDIFTQETKTALKDKTESARLVEKLKHLLNQVDDTVPSLSLSLRNIDTSQKVSSSKLIQASNILQQQCAPTFTVTLYSLFAANVRPAAVMTPSSIECTWKEEARKCQLYIEKQQRPSTDTIGYDLVLKEDTNDGLYHDPDEAVKEWRWQVDRIKKMFYTNSGQLLNIEDAKASVLVIKLLKKSNNSDPDNNSQEQEEVDILSSSSSTTSTPANVKVKETTPNIHRDELQLADWFALEIWNEKGQDLNDDSSDDSDNDDNPTIGSTGSKKNRINLDKETSAPDTTNTEPHLQMNLLLLESVIKLALLEVTEQINHLNASDELLNMYMS
ncbi:RanGTP-binding protein-domain-containing protein [Halteromyces radiatus]|uniref:RanGTP-binding protein-domain-containing protein n=1 Tax=Halteromyces radiatus TaxID=101107 RepID=UPI0022201BE8|nr:RanGTP-binding protein-domain-containing protein [Halteromyces radiatus]KAI8096942.1 RanGTP-binding protein-domain-containing protein [Halteromyces radiatus]